MKVSVLCAHHINKAFKLFGSSKEEGANVREKDYRINYVRVDNQHECFLTFIREHLHATFQDYYNVRRLHRVKMLAGSSSLQALLNNLERTGVLYHVVGEPGHCNYHNCSLCRLLHAFCAKFSKEIV